MTGIYIIQPSPHQNFPYWKQTTGSNTIFHSHGQWCVSPITDSKAFESNGHEIKLFGPNLELDWPHKISKNWLYNNGNKWVYSTENLILFEEYSDTAVVNLGNCLSSTSTC